MTRNLFLYDMRIIFFNNKNSLYNNYELWILFSKDIQ